MVAKRRRVKVAILRPFEDINGKIKSKVIPISDKRVFNAEMPTKKSMRGVWPPPENVGKQEYLKTKEKLREALFKDIESYFVKSKIKNREIPEGRELRKLLAESKLIEKLGKKEAGALVKKFKDPEEALAAFRLSSYKKEREKIDSYLKKHRGNAVKALQELELFKKVGSEKEKQELIKRFGSLERAWLLTKTINPEKSLKRLKDLEKQYGKEVEKLLLSAVLSGASLEESLKSLEKQKIRKVTAKKIRKELEKSYKEDMLRRIKKELDAVEREIAKLEKKLKRAEKEGDKDRAVELTIDIADKEIELLKLSNRMMEIVNEQLGGPKLSEEIKEKLKQAERKLKEMGIDTGSMPPDKRAFFLRKMREELEKKK
ncbi:hypothetical protein DRN74_04195 [Candidatus Micrarchaeota archaeon]|nr:MAG: hypothetical protein DRN74_04195 [Candidatus Micrarchaeota archaeon]